VVILQKGRVVADDSIERLRELMALPTLEEIFTQLALGHDTQGIVQGILDLMAL
jgi:ABC-2 type transport system ATP-binding protein